MNYSNLYMLFIAFVAFSSSLHANDTLVVDHNQYLVDHSIKLVLANTDLTTIELTCKESPPSVLLDGVWTLMSPIDQFTVGLKYQIKKQSSDDVYSLYFTELPLVSITTDSTIVDEPDVPARFTILSTSQDIIDVPIGIQYRGGWTQTRPKKSMEIEFWEDQDGSKHKDYSLLGMRTDDDWNLQAMPNEPLRIRNKTNYDLWRSINTLHYQESEPKAINGVHMEYVELFLNSEYQGLYCIGEKVDRKQLRLKKHDGSIQGELYKGVSWGVPTFGGLPPYDNQSIDWDGFEHKHPDEEVDWFNLSEFVDFAINSDDNTFYDEYPSRFNQDNLIDYFIFLNLLRAKDNTGKNIYIAKYQADDPYFYAPWDLDATFGITWMGSNDSLATELLTNRFYDRLYNEPCLDGGFRELLKEKWTALRVGPLTKQAIISQFMTNHDYLKRNGTYEREELAWSDYSYQSNHLDYLSEWTQRRLQYLDEILGGDCEHILNTPELDTDAHISKVYFDSQNFQLRFITDAGQDQADIYLYTSAGKRVYSLTNQSLTTIDLPPYLISGLYFVTLTDEMKQVTYRIVIP